MKSVEKNGVQPTKAKNIPWHIISGIIGLILGVTLSIITACYSNGVIGYLFAVVLIVLPPIFGYWVGKNGGIKLLFHEDVYYRLGGYVAFGLILFLLTWALFFFVIKQNNLLFDSMIVQKVFKTEISETIGNWGTKSFGEKVWKVFGKEHKVADLVNTWGNVLWLTVKYFINHLIFVIPFVFCLNFFRVGKINLSLIYFILYTIMWGIAIGTESVVFPYGDDKMAGSLVLFGRYGLWIWFSYLLLIASTTHFTWISSSGWLSGDWKKERKFWPIQFTTDQKEVFLYGLLFLLASCFAEARLFVHYNLF
ncbi:MAG TPA: hypothetical protein PLZ08_01095 [Bacillota bacterium]|nr:hypothetical protein [Bacillota bacterium]HOL08844.1 hypothetical protein [Bacillota bacterium]HPO96537.1 hypothetical protein [Bacillota bacterium]